MARAHLTRPLDPAPDGQPEPAEAFEDALFPSLFVEERAERTVCAADIEAAGGLTVDELGDLWRALGLPAPAPKTPYFTPDEADALTRQGTLGELWPADVYLKVARIYGHALSQVAATEAGSSVPTSSVRSAPPARTRSRPSSTSRTPTAGSRRWWDPSCSACTSVGWST